VAVSNNGFPFFGHGLGGGQLCDTRGDSTSQERLPRLRIGPRYSASLLLAVGPLRG
jgi:hypothetical protein